MERREEEQGGERERKGGRGRQEKETDLRGRQRKKPAGNDMGGERRREEKGRGRDTSVRWKGGEKERLVRVRKEYGER